MVLIFGQKGDFSPYFSGHCGVFCDSVEHGDLPADGVQLATMGTVQLRISLVAGELVDNYTARRRMGEKRIELLALCGGCQADLRCFRGKPLHCLKSHNDLNGLLGLFARCLRSIHQAVSACVLFHCVALSENTIFRHLNLEDNRRDLSIYLLL